MNSALPAGHSAAFLAILAFALPLLPLVASLPSPPMIFGVLNDFAHAVVFGALAIVLCELMRRKTTWPARSCYLLAFIVSVAAGGAVELIQPALGRTAELADWRTDALGAAAGLAIVAFASSQQRRFSGIVLVGALGAVLWPVIEASLAYWERSRQFPALVELTSPLDAYFIRTVGFETATRELPEQWHRSQDPLSLRLRGVGGSQSFAHTEPEPDWRGHKRLMLDLTNAASRPLTLTLRVHDRAHDNQLTDRFNKRISLAAGKRAVFAFPLTEIASSPASRELELSSVGGVIIFGSNNSYFAIEELYLTRIWLE